MDRLLSEDSTFWDLFPHAVKWRGDIYLGDGLHRAVRAALRNRTVLPARVWTPVRTAASGNTNAARPARYQVRRPSRPCRPVVC